jgi:hypothetical protein
VADALGADGGSAGDRTLRAGFQLWRSRRGVEPSACVRFGRSARSSAGLGARGIPPAYATDCACARALEGDRGDSLGRSAGGAAADQPQQQDPLGAPPFIQLVHDSADLRAADERKTTSWQARSKERSRGSRPLEHQPAYGWLLATRASLGWSERQPRSPIQTKALDPLQNPPAPTEIRGQSGTLAQPSVL